MAVSPRPWGWHELDPKWARLLVADASVGGGAVVIDVGAGLGSITEALLERGARVIAVEAHPGRAQQLRQRFDERVRVVQTDASDLRLPRRPYHVVANPPFALTSLVLRRLLQPGTRLLTAHLILQQQVVRRWVQPDAPGARRWGTQFVATSGRPIPRRAFRPAPHVDCRVLAITRRLDP